ncbi:MAG: hypothetical protein K0U78_02395 [Actinomycetia bacterium]|nr:hypothetical protein [Actinomycetes bacterium]
MATYHELVTLSNSTATELTPGARHSGLDLTVQNVDDTAILYIGGEGVTASSYGFKLTPGAGFSIELNPNDRLYVISDTDASEAALLRALLEDI